MKDYLAIRDLLKNGYTVTQLKQAGYTPRQIIDAGYSNAEVSTLLQTEYKELRRLMGLGYTYAELRKVGYTPWQLMEAGFSGSINVLDDFVDDLYIAPELRDTVRITRRIMDAGYTYAQVQRAASTLAQLLDAGYRVGTNSFTGSLPENTVFTMQRLTDAGYAPSEVTEFSGIWHLLKPYYTNEEIDHWAYTVLLLVEVPFTTDPVVAAATSGYAAKTLSPVTSPLLASRRVLSPTGALSPRALPLSPARVLSPPARVLSPLSSTRVLSPPLSPARVLSPPLSPARVLSPRLSPVSRPLDLPARTLQVERDLDLAALISVVAAREAGRLYDVPAHQMHDVETHVTLDRAVRDREHRETAVTRRANAPLSPPQPARPSLR